MVLARVIVSAHVMLLTRFTGVAHAMLFTRKGSVGKREGGAQCLRRQ